MRGKGSWRWMREPLLHFLLLGLLLFLAYRLLHGAPDLNRQRIDVSAEDVDRLRLSWKAQRGQLPNSAELADLIEQQVREEIMYREAIALGLERDDTIVRRRLAQKMDFLADDIGAVKAPTPEQLQNWYGQHSADFSTAPRISLRQIFFSTDERGAAAADAARAALKRLQAGGAEVAGDRLIFQARYAEKSQHEIAQVFGAAFAADVFKLAPHAWSDPIASGFGWHLVQVDTMQTGELQPFAQVESQVRDAWLRDQHARNRQAYYERIRGHYEVIRAATASDQLPSTGLGHQAQDGAPP